MKKLQLIIGDSQEERDPELMSNKELDGFFMIAIDLFRKDFGEIIEYLSQKENPEINPAFIVHWLMLLNGHLQDMADLSLEIRNRLESDNSDTRKAS